MNCAISLTARRDGDVVALSKATRLYCTIVIASGVAIMVAAAYGGHSFAMARLMIYILIAANVTTIKMKIPGLTATVSGGSLLIFAGLTDLTSAETVVVAVVVGLVQCLWKPKQKPSVLQVVFSICTLVISVMFAWNFGRWLTDWIAPGNTLALLACSTALYFGANTMLLAGVLALTEMKPVGKVWNQLYLWTFPHYMLSASLGGLFGYVSRGANWRVMFLFLPGACLAFGYARALKLQQSEESIRAALS